MSQHSSPPALPYNIGDRPVPGYTLRSYLGGGAIGHVWLAETDSGFQQALKVIDLRESGGRKEFRGLRTVKQRRLLNGYLLTLIDYWLKDATGRIVPDLAGDLASDSLLNDSLIPAPPPSKPVTPSVRPAPDATIPGSNQPAAGARKPLLPQGTMIHGAGEATLTPTPAAATPVPAAAAGRPARPETARPVQLIVAMELGHKTLFDRLQECRADGLGDGVPLEELLPYLEHAARGLDYLHREGILHRDVKPHNIMLIGDVAKVCDYGLVVAADYDLSRTTKAYTPYYASPEAVANQPLSGRADQYSLAVTYVEVRTGRLPYPNGTAPAVYLAKETGQYDLRRIANPAARRVLKRALAKEPRERFATCLEFVQRLAKAERTSLFWGRAARWAAALAAVLMLGACVASFFPPARRALWALMAVPRQTAVNELAAEPADGQPAPKSPPASVVSVDKLPAAPAQTPAGEPATLRAAEIVSAPPTSPAVQAFSELQARLQRIAEDSELDNGQQTDLLALYSAAAPSAHEFPAWEAVRGRLADALFRPLLAVDEPLHDSQQREKIMRWADLVNTAGPPLPLAALVAAEAKFANGRGETVTERAQLRQEVWTALEQLGKSNDQKQSTILDYGRFLHARLLAVTGALTPGDAADFAVQAGLLLEWRTPANSGELHWRTPRRTGQAASLIAGLAAIAPSLQFTHDALQRYRELNQPPAGAPDAADPDPLRRLVAAALLTRLRGEAAVDADSRLQLLEQSLELHRQVLERTSAADPFEVRQNMRISASRVHRDAADAKPIAAADEARRPAADDAPWAQLTKFDHLRRAVEFAQPETVADPAALPAEALVALAAAREELAHEYKLLDYYTTSSAGFQRALETSRGKQVAATAQAWQGRCALRAGLDAGHVSGNRDLQLQLFGQAQASLTQAYERATELDSQIAAEAQWRLGQLLAHCAAEGPSDLAAANPAPLSIRSIGELKRLWREKATQQEAESELQKRLTLWSRAITHFELAAELASEPWNTHWATITTDCLRARLDQVESLAALDNLATPEDQRALLAGLVADSLSLLNSHDTQPESVLPSQVAGALIALAKARSSLLAAQPDGRAAALKTLRDGESMFATPSDAWRGELVNVILEQARQRGRGELAAAEDDIQRAEGVARQIGDSRRALEARGRCLRVHADLIFAARVGEIRTPLTRELYLSFDQAQRLYVQAEAALARAGDPRLEGNLKRLRTQRSLNLKSGTFRPDFTELERHHLLQFIRGTFDLRERACGALTLLLRGELGREHQTTRFSESAEPLARSFSSLLIPAVYAGQPLDSNLAAILQVVEHKLGLEARP